MPAPASVITASGLGFAWPDGTTVLHDLDLLVSAGRSGLVGVNGAGKSGDADPLHFDTIGDAWDVEERAVAELARLGLPSDVLDRRLGEVSGGEVTQLGLARLLLRRPDVLLLDEPTNNLDADARH